MKHQGKVALVTGAAQGLGLACAERLHADGANVVLADIQTDRVKANAERLGERATWWAGDLSTISRAMADAIVDKAVTHFGALDIVVNNAGIIHFAEFVDFAEDDFDRVLRVNLRAPFLIGQAAAKAMIAQGTRRRHHQHVVDQRHPRNSDVRSRMRSRKAASSSSPR